MAISQCASVKFYYIFFSINTCELVKVAFATHCNLRPRTSRQSFWALITRPIMQQCNSLQIQRFCNLCRPIMHLCVGYQV